MSAVSPYWLQLYEVRTQCRTAQSRVGIHADIQRYPADHGSPVLPFPDPRSNVQRDHGTSILIVIAVSANRRRLLILGVACALRLHSGPHNTGACQQHAWLSRHSARERDVPCRATVCDGATSATTRSSALSTNALRAGGAQRCSALRIPSGSSCSPTICSLTTPLTFMSRALMILAFPPPLQHSRGPTSTSPIG